jgi:hypothetical protein
MWRLPLVAAWGGSDQELKHLGIGGCARPLGLGVRVTDQGAATVKDGYPILLTHEGMKKFVGQIEDRLRQQVFYMKTGQRLSYRGVILEQVRCYAMSLSGEDYDH